MRTYLWIALGGALGSLARAWGSALALRLAGAGFPWGTIAINVTGSFVIGAFAAFSMRSGAHPDLRAFVMVGLCGGFTTFSAFSLQTLELLQDGRMLSALANVALSVLLCLGAAAAGHALASGGP
ncbi:fluoride efflux transporter CrcB [Roseomonas sp. SSH11]|uniref:Fluoride-specific ion channel FluC n=1 Tax=Pararoseomonas baculiformis TaxID=2820812 RepID=A0ABS4AI58_9PROT|nr:fluoride efflux transporter CrcB [Pararoseomonas baculiformis]MBP0446569.1 fluoride efflux transporter CrcB [Pararoseomonas baculiformis]